MFFGFEPQPGAKRQGPPRNQCHSERAIAHAGQGFVHVGDLSDRSCESNYAWDKRLLAYQARVSAGDFTQAGCDGVWVGGESPVNTSQLDDMNCCAVRPDRGQSLMFPQAAAPGLSVLFGEGVRLVLLLTTRS